MSTSNAKPLAVALIGAGAIGRMHAERCRDHPDVRLTAVADPDPQARAWAAGLGLPWFADYRQMIDSVELGAVIVATPNDTHLPVGLDCIERGLPMLLEKPVAAKLADGRALCDAAEAACVPLLVAHHRRYNPIQRRARELLAQGALGRPVAASVLATWLKPDAYFELAWRRQPGGGPVLINLIHDLDQLRFMFGEVVEVQAMASGAVRGFAVEDTAAVLLRFANGMLATLLVSDTAASPWEWNLNAGEAMHYPRQGVETMFLSGTEGSLSLPGLVVWRYDGGRGWHEELSAARCMPHPGDPYREQLRHLRAVAQRREAPLCSGRDGLRSLAVALAVLESASSRQPVVPAA